MRKEKLPSLTGKWLHFLLDYGINEPDVTISNVEWNGRKSMRDVLEKLKFAVFEFVLAPGRPVEFPGFKGNVFRGALGKTLRNLTCVFKGTDTACKVCFVRDKCIYSRVFEGLRRKDGSILGNVENAPHPFVLYVPDKYRLDYPEDSNIHFFLTLIGDVVEYIPYFILALEEIGKKGIGNTRTPFKIDSVISSGKSIYNPLEKIINKDFPLISGSDYLNETLPGQTLTLELVTPTRLKFANRFQKFITFEMIMRNLLRRIQLLGALYCEGPERVDFKDLIEGSKEIKLVDSKIHWEQQTRFSYRQEKIVALGGVSGSLAFSGNLDQFMPFLKIGEFLHVGKSTAYGLGKIALGGEG